MQVACTRRLVTLAAIGWFFAALPAMAAEAEDIIPEEEVSAPRLMALFKGAFIDCRIDEDGDVRIEEDGIKTYLRVTPKKKVITFFSIWNLKESASELDKLRLVNKLNDKLLLARFCMPDSERLWCDYQLRYEKGVYSHQLVTTYRVFLKVVAGAEKAEWDEKDLIAEDGTKKGGGALFSAVPLRRPAPLSASSASAPALPSRFVVNRSDQPVRSAQRR